MLVFRGLIIAGIVFLIRALSSRTIPGQPGHDSALEILRRRYVWGVCIVTCTYDGL